jgi:hypothetical protein
MKLPTTTINPDPDPTTSAWKVNAERSAQTSADFHEPSSKRSSRPQRIFIRARIADGHAGQGTLAIMFGVNCIREGPQGRAQQMASRRPTLRPLVRPSPSVDPPPIPLSCMPAQAHTPTSSVVFIDVSVYMPIPLSSPPSAPKPIPKRTRAHTTSVAPALTLSPRAVGVVVSRPSTNQSQHIRRARRAWLRLPKSLSRAVPPTAPTPKGFALHTGRGDEARVWASSPRSCSPQPNRTLRKSCARTACPRARR